MSQHSRGDRGRKPQGRSDGSHRLRLSPRSSSVSRAQSRQVKEAASATGQKQPSQPELRLRAPKRPRLESKFTPSERSKVAERERAAGRPGSNLARGLEVKRRPTSRRNFSTSSSSHKEISHKDKDPLAKSSTPKELSDSHEKIALKKKRDRKTKEQREVERKQLQRKSKQRVYALRLSSILIAAVCALAVLIWGVTAFINSELFYPSEIEVFNARFLNEGDVRNIAAVDMQSSTITMNTAELENRLTAHPWIRNANVSTRFPNDVVIEVFERTPAVRLKVDGVEWVASSDGRWLGYLGGEGSQIVDPTGSVAVVGVRALNIIPVTGIAELEPEWGERTDDESLLNVLAHLRGLDSRIISRVSRVSAPEVGRTSLFTIDEVELDVGRADDLAEKSTIILSILEEHGEKVVLINVRSITSPTWRGLSR